MSLYGEGRLTVTARAEAEGDPRRWVRLELRVAPNPERFWPLTSDYASPYEIRELDGPYELIDYGYTRQVMDSILMSGVFYALRRVEGGRPGVRFEVRSLEGELDAGDRSVLASVASHAALELLGVDRSALGEGGGAFRLTEVSTRGKRALPPRP